MQAHAAWEMQKKKKRILRSRERLFVFSSGLTLELQEVMLDSTVTWAVSCKQLSSSKLVDLWMAVPG